MGNHPESLSFARGLLLEGDTCGLCEAAERAFRADIDYSQVVVKFYEAEPMGRGHCIGSLSPRLIADRRPRGLQQ